jgi:hypothetical protein
MVTSTLRVGHEEERRKARSSSNSDFEVAAGQRGHLVHEHLSAVQLDGGARHIAGLFGAEPTNRSAEIGLGITHPTERCRFDQSIEDLGMACMALLRHWSPSGGRHQESPNAIDAPLTPA